MVKNNNTPRISVNKLAEYMVAKGKRHTPLIAN